MKATSIDEAKSLAKSKSLETKHKDGTIHIIYCNRTEYFYVDTDGLIRLWERLRACLGILFGITYFQPNFPSKGSFDEFSTKLYTASVKIQTNS